MRLLLAPPAIALAAALAACATTTPQDFAAACDYDQACMERRSNWSNANGESANGTGASGTGASGAGWSNVLSAFATHRPVTCYSTGRPPYVTTRCY